MTGLKPLLAIGIMTGNSLDAADVVLTSFEANGDMKDLFFHSKAFPEKLQADLRRIREAIVQSKGNMEAAIARDPALPEVIETYTRFVAGAVKELVATAGLAPDVIGFHGQTCAHYPPSAAGDNKAAYTVQVGDAQLLAELTGITTIYDFRSDDVMQGGEGAPLAPMHNRHIAEKLELKGQFPITFINAGNTSNIAHITRDAAKQMVTLGWDAGPCNHFPDLLAREEAGSPCDTDGQIGARGIVELRLLHALFETTVKTRDGRNFLTAPPPKSGDPQSYLAPALLRDRKIPFENRMRTAEYFSAYLLYHSLGFTDAAIDLPCLFALFGGGWKNPVVLGHFKSLLAGDFESNPVLPAHLEWFQAIHGRFHGNKVRVSSSGDYGFDGKAMEARIFADMARCRVIGRPFTGPGITGGEKPAVCGLIRFPQDSIESATPNLRAWLSSAAPASLPVDDRQAFDGRWSRAAAGWDKKISQK